MESAHYFRGKFENLIYRTSFRIPENYEEIKFLELLEKIFPDTILCTSINAPAQMNELLREKFGNREKCILEYGVKRQVPFLGLKYFQPGVGITGPRHSALEEPLLVVEYKDQLVLMNGYHRSLIRWIRNGESETDAFVLHLES
jgi:hypothetical protein